MNNLVSVIITTYKRNDLLPRAINSVLNQTYPFVEVIVVDDNDSDSEYRLATEKLMKEKYSNHANVLYVRMANNSGACAARNRGVLAAKGKYINFLDDDDEFLPKKLEKQVKIFESNSELSVVGCYAEIVDEYEVLKAHEKTQIRGNVFFEQLCHNLNTTSLSLIRKDVYVQSGGFEQMHSSQEHWMFAKIYAINPMYDYVPEIMVRLHHHSGDRISTNKNKPLGAIELAKKVKAYYPMLSVSQRQMLEGCMLENIIFAYLNMGEKNQALTYFRKYIRNTEIHVIQKIKLGVMCSIGLDNYRFLLKYMKKI